MLSILNKPLRVWHALAMLGMVLALGVTGTAIAVQGKMNAISTRATYTAGKYKYVVTAPTARIGSMFSAAASPTAAASTSNTSTTRIRSTARTRKPFPTTAGSCTSTTSPTRTSSSRSLPFAPSSGESWGRDGP